MFKKFFYSIIIFCLVVIFLSSSTSSCILTHPLRQTCHVTSGYGYRYINGNYEFHAGIDYAASQNTPIYAMSSGTVTYCGFNYSAGNMVIIQYDNEYISMYCHLDDNILVVKGQRVNTDTLVGRVGPLYLSSGRINGYTTGVHFHFSLYYKNELINPDSISYKDKKI